MADSPRYCEKCGGYGDHHTDRHSPGVPPDRWEKAVEAATKAVDALALDRTEWGVDYIATTAVEAALPHLLEAEREKELTAFRMIRDALGLGSNDETWESLAWTIGERLKLVEALRRGLEAERERVTGTIPKGPVDRDTEFVFVAGEAFVNAAKHEQTVDRHVQRAVAAEATMREVAEVLRSDSRPSRSRINSLADRLDHTP